MKTIEISIYCKECVKHTSGNCEGREYSRKTVKYWGTPILTKLSGLNFCSQYEFDYRLYEFHDGDGAVQTVKQARQRQAIRDKTTADNQAMDDFAAAAGLSSADFD